MGVTHPDGGYSADVKVHLECGGKVYEVAEIGHYTMMLRNNVDFPEGPAKLTIEIDGEREEREVLVACIDRKLSELSYCDLPLSVSL